MLAVVNIDIIPKNQLKSRNLQKAIKVSGEKSRCFCRKGTRVMMRESTALKASK